MFSSLPIGALAAHAKVDPKDIPPPTPINLPRYQPFAQDDAVVDTNESLPALLSQTGRISAALLGPKGFRALGLDLKLDVPIHELIPDPAYVPNFDDWDRLTPDEAQNRNQATRKPLRNGNLSPGCQTYLERKKELSNTNEDGFRTVRRIPPPKGKQHARLGNTYEFFRCLEVFTTFWDDPTEPPDMPPSPELEEPTAESKPTESAAVDKPTGEGQAQGPPPKVLRTAAGHSMPADYRVALMIAFIKLVSYDFGCSVSFPRAEPRLQMSSPEGSPSPRKSYSPSGCNFIVQSPTNREAARAGAIYGPVAAASARAVTDFTTPDVETAQSLDLAREMIAALITAQHRAREGKTEVRFGEGQWWTSKPRWGGGTGGPIGREIDRDAVPGDKDAKPTDADGMPMPVTKKPRKNMSIYDNYRMIRPPSTTWDRKAHYEAIGKKRGADYDDVFLVSCLFHHISVLRVRVPLRLLEVLEGSIEKKPTERSWGKVQAWRSPWLDFFHVDQRIEAMRIVWGMMAYQMRRDDADADVPMSGA